MFVSKIQAYYFIANTFLAPCVRRDRNSG